MPRVPANPIESARWAAAAELYGVSLKTATRWGTVSTADPAPLEDAAAMLLWWDRMRAAGVYSQRCPRSIREAAPAGQGEAEAAAKAEPVQNQRLKDYLATVEGQFFDYSESLSGAEIMVRTTRFLLQEALTSGETDKIPILQTRFIEAQEAYRVAKRDEAKILDAQGVTLSKEIVRREMLALHGNITRRFRQGLRSGFEPARLALTSAEAWGKLADELVDSICTDLTATRFALPNPPPGMVPPATAV